MKIFITGGTGFLGLHLITKLVENGYNIKALIRKNSYIKDLPKNVELVYGCISDKELLKKSMIGCDTVFHFAASYFFWSKNPQLLYKNNIEGTINVIEAALSAKISKIIYTSSVIAINRYKGHYAQSKYLAEQEVWKYIKKGAPIIIVSPTVTLGLGDLKPTPSGQFLLHILQKKINIYIDGGFNFIDVEDVALGYILVLKKGKIGKRYILSGENLTIEKFIKKIEKISGRKKIALKVPYFIALLYAFLVEKWAYFISNRHPVVTREGLEFAKSKFFINDNKSIQELGFYHKSIDITIKNIINKSINQ